LVVEIRNSPAPTSRPPSDAGQSRAEFILAASRQNHCEREHQTAKRVGIVELAALPAEFLFNCSFEHAPRVEHTEGEVDAEARAGDEPAAILHGRRIFRCHDVQGTRER